MPIPASFTVTTTKFTKRVKEQLQIPARFAEVLCPTFFKKLGYCPQQWGGRQTIAAKNGKPTRGEQGILAQEHINRKRILHPLGYISAQYDQNLHLTNIVFRDLNGVHSPIPAMTPQILEFINEHLWEENQSAHRLAVQWELQCVERKSLISQHYPKGLNWKLEHLPELLYGATWKEQWKLLQANNPGSEGMDFSDRHLIFRQLVEKHGEVPVPPAPKTFDPFLL